MGFDSQSGILRVDSVRPFFDSKNYRKVGDFVRIGKVLLCPRNNATQKGLYDVRADIAGWRSGCAYLRVTFG